MKKFLRAKCVEVSNLYDIYKYIYDCFINKVNKISDKDLFPIESISNDAEKLRIIKAQYEQAYRDVSQLAHYLGKEYVQIFEEITKENGEQ